MVPSARRITGWTWWKPETLVTQRIFAMPVRSTKLFLSRSVAAQGVVHRPVHRWMGLPWLPASPVSWMSLPSPYVLSSRSALEVASTVTGCSFAAGACFHSSRKNNGGRGGPAGSRPAARAGAPEGSWAKAGAIIKAIPNESAARRGSIKTSKVADIISMLLGAERQVGGEEWQDFRADALGDAVGVVAVIDLEAVPDAIGRQSFAELLIRFREAVFIADVHADGVQLAELGYVLVNHSERCIRHPPGDDFGLRLAILDRQVEVERRILGIGRPGGRFGEDGDGAALEIGYLGASVDLLGLRVGIAFGIEIRGEAAGAQDVDAGEDTGIFHGEPDGSVAAHGVAGKAAAGGRGEAAVVAVDVRHEVARDVGFPIAGGHRVGVHAALIDVVGVGHDDDHFLGGAAGDGFIGDGGESRAGALESGLGVGAVPTFVGIRSEEHT